MGLLLGAPLGELGSAALLLFAAERSVLGHSGAQPSGPSGMRQPLEQRFARNGLLWSAPVSGPDHERTHDATPIRWWHASLLALLFALLPGPVLALVATITGKLLGLGAAAAHAQVAEQPLVLGLVSVLSMIPPLWLVRQPLPRRPVTTALGLTRVSGKTLSLAVITGLALQVPLSEVGNLVEVLAPVPIAQKQAMARLLSADTWPSIVALLLSVSVAAPVCEELLFRGALVRGMRRVHGKPLALGLTSALFGLAHAGLITSVLPAALAGLAFGWITLRSGSIVPSIAMHAAVNAVPVILSRSRLEITGFNTVQAGVYHVPPQWLVPSCVIALVGFWWLHRSSLDEHRAALANHDRADS